jgi:hypothetical protein
MKIALCTLAIGEQYKKMVKYGQLGKQLYCQRHGYDYRDDEDVYDSTRPPAWSKIKSILKCLEEKNDTESKYDYVVWIDADTHIMNPDWCLEDFIYRLSDGRDVMVAQDFKEINSGVIFVKNTEWSKLFLHTVYDQTQFINFSHWDQDAILHVYETGMIDSHKHIKRLYCLQSHEFSPYYQVFRPGMFLIHLAGCFRDGANLGIDHMMNMFCPLRMDEDTDESYQTRMEFIKNWQG